jgi:hypothetical protein
MAKKTLKCDLCDEIIEDEGNFFETRDGKIACEGCFDIAWEDASKAIVFKPDGTHEEIVFCEDFGMLEDLGNLPEPVKKEKWVKTDGWRGYTDWELNEGWVDVAEGWVTGYPDETTQRKVELHDYFEKMLNGELIPPVEVWWFFGKTSNVFSTASKIVCRAGDLETLKEWLEEINEGVEHFQEMLD